MANNSTEHREPTIKMAEPTYSARGQQIKPWPNPWKCDGGGGCSGGGDGDDDDDDDDYSQVSQNYYLVRLNFS
jgi:hypothetical protein